jgi:uncharacterized protein YbaR (Trm112 family)
MPVNPDLMKILCCPNCRSELTEENNFILCSGCKLKYEIKNDIPILLIEKAILPPGVNNLSELKSSEKGK